MRLIACAVLLLLAQSSCRSPRHIYAPSLPATTFFQEKGESKIAGYYAGYGSSGQGQELFTGYEVQGAYAFAPRWTVMIGHGFRKERDLYGRDAGYPSDYFLNSHVFYKRRMTDVGFGYFVPVDRKRTVYIGVNSGMGFGNFSMNENGLDRDTLNYSRIYGSNLTKIYFQPFIAIHASDFFKLGLSTRISWVHFSESKNTFSIPETEFLQLNRIRRSWHSFFEPAMSAQFQLPQAQWIKLEGGLQLSTDPYSRALESRSFTPFIGLSFDFSRLKKKR